MLDKSILVSLTNIQLTSKLNDLKESEFYEFNGMNIPVYKNDVFVIGSGAAGLRCAVELANRDIKVTVVTSMLFAGTSACSGSDKQTLFSCATSKHGDDVLAVAQAIGAGGAMDGDLAYIEASNSYLAIDALRAWGLPLPQDRYGAVLRYKTDHDEAGRATSLGPRTSRFMVKVLMEQAEKNGVSLLDRSTVIKLLVCKGKCYGAIAINPFLRSHKNPLGIMILLSSFIVLAGGGAGLLYKNSVYPLGCVGTTGLALEAGLMVSNIQEMQFGIGSDQSKFPWNLSGTYMQVIPDVYSVDEFGNKYHFLKDYYRSTAEICSNLFRKGYQWPIHASRMLNYGSSLFDLAVYLEKKKGRRVLLDFRQNYQGEEKDPYDFENLDEDVKQYLINANAKFDSPIQRLEAMNQLAIEIYLQNGIDLKTEPLDFNVNHQHFNGGIKVGNYANTSVENCYAIGESAGTHGVTRPGGSALNSGQVFAIRAAEQIKFLLSKKDLKSDSILQQDLLNILNDIFVFANKCENNKHISYKELKEKLQSIVSDNLGFICNQKDVSCANETIRQLRLSILSSGVGVKISELYKAFEIKNLLYEAEAISASLLAYIEQGGGSRGARVICSEESNLYPEALNIDLKEYAFLKENVLLQEEIIEAFFFEDLDKAYVNIRKKKPIPDVSDIFFEKNWTDFLTGNIFIDSD